MAKNDRVSEETFGHVPTGPKMSGGRIHIFGHPVHEGEAIPARGYSPNEKTGHPANDRGRKN